MSEYTNRHGKKIRIDQADSTLDPSQNISSPKESSTSLRQKRSIRLPKLKLPLKKILFGVAVVAVIAGVLGMMSADSTKRQYERQTAAMKRTITERTKQSSSADSSAVLVVKSLRESLTASTDCRVSGVDVVSWYGPAKEARQQCQLAADAYRKLQFALDDMTNLAVYTEKVKSALHAPLAEPAGGEFAIVAEYAQAWQDGVKELEGVQPPEIARSSQAELVSKAQAARDAWVALEAANTAQNVEAFKKAEKDINDRYADLRTTTENIQVLISSTQASIDRYIAELS